MICDSYLNLSLISGLPRKGVKCVYIVFSLERQLKRENNGAKKANGVVGWCKYSRDSYLNLSLISGLPRKGYFLS
jgi:hypothetical protein